MVQASDCLVRLAVPCIAELTLGPKVLPGVRRLSMSQRGARKRSPKVAPDVAQISRKSHGIGSGSKKHLAWQELPEALLFLVEPESA